VPDLIHDVAQGVPRASNASVMYVCRSTETLPALALGREPAEPGIMDRPPRSRSRGIIDRPILTRACGGEPREQDAGNHRATRPASMSEVKRRAGTGVVTSGR
jgi:hypothetical protein